MQYRRSGPRDERRRRVLMDQSLTNQTEEDANRNQADSASQTQRLRYGQTAHHSRQPPVTVLIPKRRFTWIVLLGIGLSLISAVLASYGWIYVMQSRLPRWQILDPQTAGSFASWLSSSLLLIGAIGCLLTYGLRRHRIDDYRGGYRYWLWGAAAFVLGSVNTSVAMHELLGDALGTTAQLAAFGVWLLIGSVLLFLLAPEVICSRLATASLLVAFASYALATSISLGEILPPAEPIAVLAGAASAMLGHLAMVSAVGLYVRYVYLDAHELLPVRRTAQSSTKAKESSKAKKSKSQPTVAHETDSTSGKRKTGLLPKSNRNGSASTTKQQRSDLDDPVDEEERAEARPAEKGNKTKARLSLQTPKSKAAEQSLDDRGEEDMQNLSKSERRRLRKLKRRRAA